MTRYWLLTGWWLVQEGHRVQVELTHSWETNTNTHTHSGDKSSVPSYLLIDPNLCLSPLTSSWGISLWIFTASLTYWAENTPAKFWTLTYAHVNPYTHTQVYDIQTSTCKSSDLQETPVICYILLGFSIHLIHDGLQSSSRCITGQCVNVANDATVQHLLSCVLTKKYTYYLYRTL